MSISITTLRAMAQSPAEYRRHLLIDTDHGPKRLDDILDDWQRRNFEALDASWQRVAGLPVEAAINRSWDERPRGHSKTTDIAVSGSWVIAFSPRLVRGQCYAADSDQSRLIRNAVESIVRVNPWLSDVLSVGKNAVENTRTGSRLEISSADAKSSYGILPDFIVCDELTHWPGRDLWDSIVSSAAKRAHCLLTIITNAGHTGSWQHDIRKAVEHDPNWHFSALDGPQASWITPDRLAEQARLLPESVCNRLWYNKWTDGSGDALSWHDVKSCLTMPRFHPRALHGFEYALSLDLGRKHDHAALAVLGMDHGRNLIAVAECLSWSPKDFEGNEISFRVIRDAARHLIAKFKPLALVFDPWQSHLLSEDLGVLGLNLVEVPFTNKNCSLMAQTLLMAFRRRQIELPDYGPLLADLQKLRILERPAGGYKLDAERDERGHADRAIAVALGLPPCFDYIANPAFREAANQPTVLTP